MTAVSVTARRIAKGVPGDCGWCPVALAMAVAFPGLTYLSVGLTDIIVQFIEGGKVSLSTPREVHEFIRAFDLGQPVEPFTFELDYPAVTR